ncbi:MAG: P-type conjugative transfer protein TrbL [Methyloligellaceae bacterium]
MTYKLEVIDHITKTFTDYIDSGFGLLQPDVAYLTTVLVTIDIVIAGLFRALLNDQYMPNNLIQKTLYIGFFAFILNNYPDIANLIYLTFANLGVKAGQATFSGEMLLKPAFIAETGIKTGGALVYEAGRQLFAWSLNASRLSALVLLPAGLFVIVAFLILSVHLFLAIIVFKLTTLVGFILVPFALFGKTTFLADRVLTSVMTSGIKLMIIGIIAGIGSSIFEDLILPDSDITLEQAASAVLASLAILCLSFAVSELAFSMIMGVPVLGTAPAVKSGQVIQEISRTTINMGSKATQAASYIRGGLSKTFRTNARGKGHTGRGSNKGRSGIQGVVLKDIQLTLKQSGSLYSNSNSYSKGGF